MTSPFKLTAYFHIWTSQIWVSEQIAELTYSADLHKILQLLLLKRNKDHQLFPICVLPQQYFSSRDIMWIFLVTFCRPLGGRAQNLTSHGPQAATHALTHRHTWWHTRPLQKDLSACKFLCIVEAYLSALSLYPQIKGYT